MTVTFNVRSVNYGPFDMQFRQSGRISNERRMCVSLLTLRCPARKLFRRPASHVLPTLPDIIPPLIDWLRNPSYIHLCVLTVFAWGNVNSQSAVRVLSGVTLSRVLLMWLQSTPRPTVRLTHGVMW